MVHECATTAENGRKFEEPSFSASRDGVAAAEGQPGAVPAGPGGGVEAESPDAGQLEQVRLLVWSSHLDVVDGD